MANLAAPRRAVNPARVLFDATRPRPRATRPFGAGLLAGRPAYRPEVTAEDRAAHLAGLTLTASEWAVATMEAELASRAAALGITPEELLAREEAEEEARLMACCPAEVHEESLYRFEA
ncbi:hypothetical protein EP7_005680 (plasmid) [Isosphaeraceae bacterium EP7]